jgi:hypothetical protein
LYEKPFWVVLCGLLLDAEVSPASRVCADACDVLPVTVITGDVEVDQVLLKKRGTITPVMVVLIDQTAGRNLTPAIAHPASGQQLAHQRI